MEMTETVTIIQFVGEQQPDVEDPEGRDAPELARTGLGETETRGDNCEYLDGRGAVKGERGDC